MTTEGVYGRSEAAANAITRRFGESHPKCGAENRQPADAGSSSAKDNEASP